MAAVQRERKSTEFFDPTADGDSSKKQPRFDFSKGTGEKLSSLPKWVSAPRGNAADALESALEPLHRALFGRPGKQGERRAALADYCGFADDANTNAIMKSKVVSWKKDQLKDLSTALGTGLLVSVPVAELAEGLLKFLQSPRAPPQKEKKAPTPREKVEQKLPAATEDIKKPATSEAEGAPAKKKSRVETPVACTSPSDDAIRVAVYRRVMRCTASERDNLHLKEFRLSLESEFRLTEGSLKDRSHVIREAVAEVNELIATVQTEYAKAQTEEEPAAVVDSEEPAATATAPADEGQ